MWNWGIYGALLVGFLAGMAAIALVLARAVDAWRTFNGFRRGLGNELERLADLGEITADKLETASDTRELESSLTRLRLDLARMAVLRQALDETQQTFERFAFLVPRK